MSTNKNTYVKAILRNLSELNNAILKRRALIGIHNSNSVHGLDFFQIAADALYNDMLSHAMRVFEDSKNVASFWYIVNANEVAAKKVATDHCVSLDIFKPLQKDLKEIRNKHHFHIDKKTLMGPRRGWVAAVMTGDELGILLDKAFCILSALHKRETGENIVIPDYDGTDVVEIIRSYKKCNPSVPIIL